MEEPNFGWALRQLYSGNSLTRAGWNGDHKINLQIPDEHSKMTEPYIYITTENGNVVPWLASQTDMLAVDWEVVQ